MGFPAFFLALTLFITGEAMAAASPTSDTEIARIAGELEHVTTAINAVINYAVDPKGTVKIFTDRLDKEQIRVGLAIQKARAADDQVELARLEKRYSEIFNELIEVKSYGRLPKSLIGASRDDVVALFERRWNLTQELSKLQAKRPTAPEECHTLFGP